MHLGCRVRNDVVGASLPMHHLVTTYILHKDSNQKRSFIVDASPCHDKFCTMFQIERVKFLHHLIHQIFLANSTICIGSTSLLLGLFSLFRNHFNSKNKSYFGSKRQMSLTSISFRRKWVNRSLCILSNKILLC